jgi:hypothetical protein
MAWLCDDWIRTRRTVRVLAWEKRMEGHTTNNSDSGVQSRCGTVGRWAGESCLGCGNLYVEIISCDKSSLVIAHLHLSLQHAFHTLLFVLLFFFVVFGFELRPLCLLTRYSTTWATLSALSICLEIGSYFMPRLAWTASFYLCFPMYMRWRAPHSAQPLVEMGFHELFSQAGFKPRSSPSQPHKLPWLQAGANVPSFTTSF